MSVANQGGTTTTSVTAIDGSTGAGNTLIDGLIGSPASSNNLVVDDNGNVYLTTFVNDQDGRKNTVTVVDSAGAPVTSADVYGENNTSDFSIAMSPDGKTVYYAVTDQSYDPDTYYAGGTTTVLTFDTTTGMQRTPVL